MRYQCSICKVIFEEQADCARHEKECAELNERRIFIKDDIKLCLEIAEREQIRFGVQIPAKTEDDGVTSVYFNISGVEMDVQKNEIKILTEPNAVMKIIAKPNETENTKKTSKPATGAKKA